ncbi:MAG: RHS repeat-associated core domain-containing protein [Terracidiphilus sp.]
MAKAPAATRNTTSAVSWGQGSTSSTVASGLASAINTAASAVVTATANGDTVELVSNATGSGTDYAVSASVIDTQTANYPSLFPSPSYQADAVSMAGGRNAASSYGTIYSYSVPAGGYAPNGNLLSYDDPIVMGSWDFQYDTLNRVAAASSTAPKDAPSGHPTNSYPNYCWSYDAFGNRTEQMSASVVFASGQGGGNTCSTTGNLGENVWAQYNGANNQMSATSQNGSQSSYYDASGNVTYDGSNFYAYDGEGRLCAVYDALASSMTGYAYDAEGRLCAVQLPSINGGTRYQYLYDATGTRVGKATFTGSFPAINTTCAAPGAAAGFVLTAQYLLDQGGDQVTELNTTSGTMAWAHSNVWAGAHLDATYDTKGLHFHLSDPLGTRRVQSNTYGQVEENILSLPFGDGLSEVIPTGAPATADDATEHHFTGKERDTESGNDYFGARYYGSSMGRMMSPDPGWLLAVDPTNPQSWNQYAYVLNNPLRFTDPSGMECVWDDGSYDAADDPDTGSADKCSGQGGTWVDPDLFENALLTNGQNANIQYGSWSGQANSTIASSWLTSSSTTTTTDDGSLLAAVQNTLGAVQQNGFDLTGIQNYTAMDVFNWAATGTHTPNGCASGVVGCLYHHGHWCGAGGSGAPVDATDSACLVHDFLYAMYGYTAGSNYDGYNPGLQEINQGLCDTAGNGAISAYFGSGVEAISIATINWTGNPSCK